MAIRVPLVLHENNDETVAITITGEDPDEDLSAISSLELYLKIAPSYADDDLTTLVLTSSDITEIDILTQTTTEITAEAYIPKTALVAPYDRFWHLDALTGTGLRKTAFYGPVDVVNL